MFVPPYQLEELKFAYCIHVYYRWHTYCRLPHPGMMQITPAQLESERPDVRILNLKVKPTEVALLASLHPGCSVSVGASKIKGAVCQLTRKLEEDAGREKTAGDGYFACTVGKRTSQELDRYLDTQAAHHGYDRQVNAPVLIRAWPDDRSAAVRQAHHTATDVRWHFVFSTWDRKGTFTQQAAGEVVRAWESRVSCDRVRLIKVSFLPDHVHLAIRTHPAIVPAALVTELLNSSQELMVQEFSSLMIRTGNPRIWKPGAYIGTVGDLVSGQTRAYLEGWSRRPA